jgi:hypothetical protein
MIAGSAVRIPLRKRMFDSKMSVVYCVGKDLCETLITRSQETYRVRVPNCVRSRYLEVSSCGIEVA